MTTVLPLSAFWITKCYCLRKLCKDSILLSILLLILLLLKLSKEDNTVSKIFYLTALVLGIYKSVFLKLRKMNILKFL